MADSPQMAYGLSRIAPPVRAISGQHENTSGVPTGKARTDRFLRYTLSAIRILNCTTSLVALVAGFGQYRMPILVAAVFATVVGWSIYLFGWATRGRMVTSELLTVDIGLALTTLIVIGLECTQSSATDWTNWSFAYALTVVLTAAAVLRPIGTLAVAALFGAAYLGAVFPAISDGNASLANAVGNAISFVGFAIFGLVIAGHLHRTGADLDAALHRALVAEADRARIEDRVARNRTLHNTVLATLTGIARGGLDYRADSVRARCARQADYLRRLIEGDITDSTAPLAMALTEILEHAAEAGLRVSSAMEHLPVDLPPEVVRGLTAAAEEALENVRRHSGEDHARLTAVAEQGQVTIRVIDQGVGFSPETVAKGFGLNESIERRMRDAGGASDVTSFPGEGVWVELWWPA